MQYMKAFCTLETQCRGEKKKREEKSQGKFACPSKGSESIAFLQSSQCHLAHRMLLYPNPAPNSSIPSTFITVITPFAAATHYSSFSPLIASSFTHTSIYSKLSFIYGN
ncbi:hypothetical protein E2C01_020466 [Portunus trituberculatus]|uniref:Uncharacterized protein n=1 Tax=Portunus trituberculatus TaxID=210409 RepID=A0A5B7E0J1_PORTR|nr:hypothetical protein [Portunus trituberculatus]